MSKSVVRSEAAPPATTRFSQAVRAGGFFFTTQVGKLPSGDLVEGGITEQARQCLTNVQRLLAECGGSLKDVVVVTVFLADLREATAVNGVYESFFSSEPPTRACIGVAALGAGVRVEMQVVAYVGAEPAQT